MLSLLLGATLYDDICDAKFLGCSCMRLDPVVQKVATPQLLIQGEYISQLDWRFVSEYVVVVVVYPTPSEGWGHGGRPWSPRSRATPQGLDQRS